MPTTLTAAPYPYTAAATRTNRCTNPSFETALTGWTALGSGGALQRLNYGAWRGTWHARTVAASAGEVRVGTTGYDVSVLATQVWTLSAWVRGTAGRSMRLRASYTPSTATLVYGAPVVTTGGWQRVSVTVTVPASQTGMAVAVVMDAAGVAVGDFLDVDGVLFENSAIVSEYLDGSMSAPPGTRYAWAGLAHASISTLERRTPASYAQQATPLLVVTREDARDGVVNVHRILGSDRTVVTVASRPAALRSGSMEVLCADVAAADAVVAVLRSGTVMVTDTDNPTLGMYMVASRVQATPADGKRRWTVTCDWYEVGIEGDAW